MRFTCRIYGVDAKKVAPKQNPMKKTTVLGSQFEQPLLEFSGACAGCGETPYAKLLTQLFGDRMMVANATGCSSIWGGSAPAMPYTKNHKGHGPAWANSLFEDNAEFGLGMFLGTKSVRDALAADAKAAVEAGKGSAVKRLAEILSVDIKDTYAAGDEQNDISMIKAAGCGIAMVNGTDLVKKSADVITTYDNDHDGLAEFILGAID